MHTPALYFEVFSILVIALLGCVLLSLNLPGWGLIATAGILCTFSVGLRAPRFFAATTKSA